MILPGDKKPDEYLASMLRVNHAGEYGAKRIYSGQLAVLKDADSQEVLSHMKAQEDEHFDVFSDMMSKQYVRPTLLQPLWNIAGYGLGFLSAKISKPAAMAVTVAVEETIEEHYNKQIDNLNNQHIAIRKQHPDIVGTLERIRDEEVEHRDIGLDHHAQQSVAYPLINGVVKIGCKISIWLAKRV